MQPFCGMEHRFGEKKLHCLAKMTLGQFCLGLTLFSESVKLLLHNLSRAAEFVRFVGYLANLGQLFSKER